MYMDMFPEKTHISSTGTNSCTHVGTAAQIYIFFY